MATSRHRPTVTGVDHSNIQAVTGGEFRCCTNVRCVLRVHHDHGPVRYGLIDHHDLDLVGPGVDAKDEAFGFSFNFGNASRHPSSIVPPIHSFSYADASQTSHRSLPC